MFLPRRARRRRDDGASAVEYTLLVAAVAVVVLAVILGLASIVKDAFGSTSDCVGSNGTSTNCPATPTP